MAQANLLSPPSQIPPPVALQLSQKAPPILAAPPTSSLPWPLSLLFTRETPESWAIHENLFLASIRTGDDASARQILDRLTARFGEDNERIVTMHGIYEEALAKDDKALERIFEAYEKILRDDPTNFGVRKRRVAVLKSLGRTADAITALTVLVENSPIDAEAWAELSELYAGVGAWGQAIFSMEEVLLIMPNSWSAHAQVATLHYLSSPTSLPALSLALRHFARSVELNEYYLRGYYGLKLVAEKLIPLLSDSSSSNAKRNTDDDDVPPPNLASVKKLDELATSKLAEIVRQYGSGKKGWTGFDEAEVIAARELLDRK
ncbi:TPR-like protein [Trematosphaeria pertusa]|uniref:ER membrane protein complex subunit 2 n=1 Tax=Trematosphaeria pertusa TaxID=390896 RepID=A0A6A6HWG8_9PLEO|nr:TPR-like protein [Trematosphaeria pertusa]KAF2242554.1 TPR-like protein [Trematosphaeria pertusa]